MSRFIFTSVAVALVCGFGGSASAQSGWLAGGEVQTIAQKPVVGTKPVVSKVPAPAPVAVDEKATFQTPELVKYLPRLGSDFRILYPASKSYNAYAYLIGVNDRWMDVATGPAENPLEGMDRHLASAGYRRSEGLDASLRVGVQKIVVYATVKPDGDIDTIQSAAVQMADGSWSAKIGGMAVIQFSKVNQLCGPNYGRPVAVYERVAVKGFASR